MNEPRNKEEAVVSLTDVRKTYQMGSQAVHALDGVSVDFMPGSYWAIMGASGSGKSTLLNLLGCLDVPTSGRYLLQGNDVGSMDDDALSDVRLRHIGFIFQSFNLIPSLTVRENIELPLYYQGWESDHSAARISARALGFVADLGAARALGCRHTTTSGDAPCIPDACSSPSGRPPSPCPCCLASGTPSTAGGGPTPASSS